MSKPLAQLWAITAGLILAGPLTHAAQAQVMLTFSGGSGSPLTVTLAQPVTYAVTSPPSGGILFDFKGVGNVFGGTVNLNGVVTYAVNGGAPNSITTGTTGASAGAIATTDLLLFHNPATGAALGNTVVLSSGSLSTAINVATAAPASGLYNAILVDQSGNQIGVGVAVPEPSSLAVTGVGCVLTAVARWRRRRAASRGQQSL